MQFNPPPTRLTLFSYYDYKPEPNPMASMLVFPVPGILRIPNINPIQQRQRHASKLMRRDMAMQERRHLPRNKIPHDNPRTLRLSRVKKVGDKGISQRSSLIYKEELGLLGLRLRNILPFEFPSPGTDNVRSVPVLVDRVRRVDGVVLAGFDFEDDVDPGVVFGGEDVFRCYNLEGVGFKEQGC